MSLDQIDIRNRLEEIRRENSLDLLGVADTGRGCLELTSAISEQRLTIARQRLNLFIERHHQR